MNLAEIRKIYPQYADLSDEQIARGMHKKFYPDMDWGSFSKKIGYETAPLPQIPDESRQEIDERLAAYNQRQNSGSDLLKGLGAMDLQDWADVAKDSQLGAEKVASGATLGGYDWANRKLGGDFAERQADFEKRSGLAGKLALGGLDLAGNIAGAGGASYNLAKKGLSAAGKAAKTQKLAKSEFVPLVLSAAADSGLNSAFASDFGDWGKVRRDMGTGALAAGALGTAGKVLSPVSRVFSENAMTKGLRGGLENVASQPEAVKIMNSGIRQSDDIAQEFLKKAPAAARNINAETAASLNRSLKRRIDVPETIMRQKEKYRNFLERNADMEVLDFAETPALARRYVLDNKDYQPVLKSIRRNMQKNDPSFAMGKTPEGKIDYPHFLKDRQRAEYVTTLPGTYKNPQHIIKGQHNGKEREYLLKQYHNSENGKNVYDVVIKAENGTLINKFAREGIKGQKEFDKVFKNASAPQATARADLAPSQTEIASSSGAPHIGNIFSDRENVKGGKQLREDLASILEKRNFGKMRRLRTSAGGTASRTGQMEGTSVPAEQHTGNILSGGENVKIIKELYRGLTPFQKNAFEKAVRRGTAKTNRKAGSLDSVNRIKQELNDMLVKSQNINPNNRLASVDSADTVALREVKNRIDNVLGKALKGRDRGYRKAKQLEEAYNAGLRYNPDNMGTVDLVSGLSPLGRQGFAQGLFRRLTNNPLTGKNLAADILKQENSLAGVLPQGVYNPLMENLNRQAARFGRLSGLGRKAESRLQTPEANRLFAREQLESKGSLIGAGVDWLNSRLRGRALEKASRNLMNPDFSGLKDSWVVEKYPYLANYLALQAGQN